MAVKRDHSRRAWIAVVALAVLAGFGLRLLQHPWVALDGRPVIVCLGDSLERVMHFWDEGL